MPSPLENAVHGIVQRMFPFHVVDGWAYKGFTFEMDEGRPKVNLQFVKKLMNRRAFCILHVFTETVNAPGFDLKAWIRDRLEEEERGLLLDHHNEFAGVA